jgi:hypothetical protein
MSLHIRTGRLNAEAGRAASAYHGQRMCRASPCASRAHLPGVLKWKPVTLSKQCSCFLLRFPCWVAHLPPGRTLHRGASVRPRQCVGTPATSPNHWHGQLQRHEHFRQRHLLDTCCGIPAHLRRNASIHKPAHCKFCDKMSHLNESHSEWYIAIYMCDQRGVTVRNAHRIVFASVRAPANRNCSGFLS